MTARPGRPWLILLPLLLLILAGLIWSIYWFAAIELAKDRFARERNSLQHRGLSLSCNVENWGGFPFRFEFACSSPALRMNERLEIKSGSLLAIALAYNPWQVVVLVDGPTAISGLTPLPVNAKHQRAIASVTIGKNNQPSMAVDLPKLGIGGLLSADRVRFDSRTAGDGRIEIAASVEGLNYQPAGRPELRIERSDVHGFLSAGNTFSVEKVVLSQGTVRYWGMGKVQIDAANRIAGKLSTETNDLDGLMSILEPHLDLTASQVANLRKMLGLLGNESRADITARDGQLYVGPFKIAGLVPLY